MTVQGFNDSDLRIDIFRDSATVAVRVTHLETGISGSGQVQISLGVGGHEAKAIAMQQLLAKLDGSRAAEVALLAGITREQLEDVGGVEEDDD